MDEQNDFYTTNWRRVLRLSNFGVAKKFVLVRIIFKRLVFWPTRPVVFLDEAAAPATAVQTLTHTHSPTTHLCVCVCMEESRQLAQVAAAVYRARYKHRIPFLNRAVFILFIVFYVLDNNKNNVH